MDEAIRSETSLCVAEKKMVTVAASSGFTALDIWKSFFVACAHNGQLKIIWVNFSNTVSNDGVALPNFGITLLYFQCKYPFSIKARGDQTVGS